MAGTLLQNWLRWLKSPQQAARRQRRQPGRETPRRQVTCGDCLGQIDRLENRYLLTTISWNVDADGFWDDAANWQTDMGEQRVPNSSDTVVISRPAFDPTVTVRDDRQVAALTNTETIVLTAGTFHLTGGSELNGGLTIAGGNLQVDGGAPLVLNGQIDWQSGALIAGPGFTNAGTLTITSSNDKVLYGYLLNEGQIVQQDAGNLLLNTSARLDVAANGVYDFQGTGGVSRAYSGGGFTPIFNVFGTLRKSSDTGTATINGQSGDLNLNLVGTAFDIQTGTLALVGNRGENTGATFSVATDAAVLLQSHDAARFAGTYTGSGAGHVRLQGAFVSDNAGAMLNFPDDLLEWENGYLAGSGTGIDIVGSLSITTADDKVVYGTVIDHGVIEHKGTGRLLVNTSSHLDVAPGGVYDFQGDGGIGRSAQGGGFNPYVLIQGTLRKTGGTGTSLLDGGNDHLDFNIQGGTLDVSSGVLQLDDGGSWQTATLNAQAGGTLQLTGDRGISMVGLISGSGAGRIDVLNAGFSSSDFGVANAHATLDFPEDLFYWLGGAFGSSGSGSGVGSATTLVNAGFITLDGPDTKATYGSGLINQGTMTNIGSGTFTLSASVFTNQAGAVYDSRGDGPFSGTDQFGNAGRLINSGLLLKSAGSGTVDVTAQLENSPTGMIEVQEGRLLFSRGGNSTGGTFEISAGAFLEFGGSNTHRIAGTYTGTGPGTLELNGLLEGAETTPGVGAVLDFPDGMFVIHSGQLLGSLINDGVIDFAPANGLFARAGIVNNGVFRHSGAGDFVLNANSRFVNNGLYDLQTDADLVVPGDASGGSMYFINSATGVFRKSGGTLTSSLRHDGSFKELRFDNVGTVEVLSGTLEFADGVNQFSNGVLTDGTWHVGPFSTLTVPNATNITINQGHVILDGTNSTFAKINSLLTNRGTFALAGGRDFTTAGNLTNSGTLDIGPESVLNVTGTLTQVPVNHLVGWWQAEGNTNATTGGINGTINGNVTYATGHAGQAFDLDGDGDFVSLGNPAALRLQDFTISAWIKRDSLTQGGLVFTYGQNGYALGLFDDGRLLLSNVGLSAVETSHLAITDTEFHHLVVTKSATNVTFYVDGVAETTVPYVTTFSFFTNAAIGARADNSTGSFPGLIDEVAVFDRRLSPAEVQAVGAASDPNTVGNSPPRVLVHIDGRPNTGLYGRINVTGAATLTGTLDIDTALGFAPPTGDTYTVLTYASHTGEFTTFDGIDNFYTVDSQAAKLVLNSIATPPLDLVVSDVSVDPLSLSPGTDVTVTYTVQNQIDEDSTFDWVDSIYVSLDGNYSPDDVLLTRVTHTGGVAGLASYTETVTAQFPGVLDGSYHILVIANSRGQLRETTRTNNFGASTAEVAVTIPVLTLETTTPAQIRDGQDLYYRIDVPAVGDIVLNSLFSVQRQAEVFVKYGGLPTRSDFTATSSNLLQLQRELLLASPQPGPLYVLVHGREGAVGSTSFSLTPEHVLFDLRSVSPVQGANVGSVTLTLVGSGFSNEAVVTLLNDLAQPVATATVSVLSPNKLFATFDLTGLPVGFYDVKITDQAGNDTLADGFEVTTGQVGTLRTDVLMPGRVRGGSTFTAYVVYTNVGQTDLIAPLITVSTPSDSLFQIPALGTPFVNRYSFLAASAAGVPGILRPGESVRVPILVQATSGFNEIKTAISYTSNDYEFNWNSLVGSLFQEQQTVPNFSEVWAALVASNGPTVGDYVDMLARNATLITPAQGNPQNPLDLLRLEFRRVQASLTTSLTGRIDTSNFTAQVRGVQITATNLDTLRAYTTTTLADGSFIFESLTAGHYEFRVAGSTVLTPTSGATVVADGQHLTNVLITVEDAFTIGGLVLDDQGDPVPLANIFIYHEDQLVGLTAADTQGRYTVPDLAPGIYSFVVTSDEFARSWLNDVDVMSDLQHLNLTMSSESSISGTVILDGAPAVNPLIFATIQGGVPLPLFAMTGGSDGQFTLTGLPAGTYDILINVGDFITRLEDVVVAADQALSLGTLEFTSGEPGAQPGALPGAPPPEPHAPALEQALLEAEAYLEDTWIRACIVKFGLTTAGLWQLYLDGSYDNKPGRQFFSGGSDIIEGNSVAKGFRDSRAINEIEKSNLDAIRSFALHDIRQMIESGQIDCDSIQDYNGLQVLLFEDLPSVAPKVNLPTDFEYILEIPGNLAGGIGVATPPFDESVGQQFPDRRYLTGTVTISTHGKHELEVKFNVKFVTEDTIDFLPGNPGTGLEQIFTTSMIFLEGHNHAYDVPFTAEFYLDNEHFFQPEIIRLPEGEENCDDDDPDLPGSDEGGRGGSGIVVSSDPNEKETVGSADPGGNPDVRYVLGDTQLAYTVRYENVPTAAAPAQRVVITDVLDDNLDLSTFELGEFRFGDFTVAVPAGRTSYMVRVDVTAELGMFVDFEASLDEATRTVTWKLTAIDPTTGDTDESNPDFGFLPPNDAEGHGTGYVTYFIRPLAELADDTAITNTADIVFDFNSPITTNTVTNIIDLETPTSSVTALPAESGATFHVSWTGSDGTIGSGIAYYDVYVSVDNGPYTLYLAATTDTGADYAGAQGHSYAFYTVATDGVGHVEGAPAEADTQTTVPPNRAPDLLDAVFSLAENSPAATLLGIPTVNDPDIGDTTSFTITGGSGAGIFAINPTTGAITVVDPSALDFETTTTFTLSIQVTDTAGASDTAIITINLTDANDTPQLVAGDEDVTFSKKAAKKNGPTGIVPHVQVLDADQSPAFRVGGGTLTLSIDVVGKQTKKGLKSYDSLGGLDSLSSLGTVSDPAFANGRMTVTISLNAGTTAASTQNALRGLTFKTVGKGLKQATRTLRAQLTDAAGATSGQLEQTIHVTK